MLPLPLVQPLRMWPRANWPSGRAKPSEELRWLVDPDQSNPCQGGGHNLKPETRVQKLCQCPFSFPELACAMGLEGRAAVK